MREIITPIAAFALFFAVLGWMASMMPATPRPVCPRGYAYAGEMHVCIKDAVEPVWK